MTSRQDVQKRRVWAERLGRYRASGLTVARFCASERVSVNSFYYWAKRVSTDASVVPLNVRRTQLEREPVGHARVAVGTVPSALVRFHFNAAVEVSVPADCLDAIRCLAQCVQYSQAARSDAFQEVVVAKR